jgi:hypothetical protein
MKQGITIVMLVAIAHAVVADQLVKTNGDVIEGTFNGFQNHQMVFSKTGGGEVREFAANIKTITVDPFPLVSVELINRRWNSVMFKGYDKNQVCLQSESGEIFTPATMLKGIAILSRTRKLEVSASGGVVAEGEAVREWRQSGDWRKIENSAIPVISRGEDINIASRVREGVVSVVHFHYPSSHSSVRQGNYIETIAMESKGSIAMSRVVVTNWSAPICKAKEIKTLPQFWFYGPAGTLVKKLTDRFTESDIDAAIKQASGTM